MSGAPRAAADAAIAMATVMHITRIHSSVTDA